MSLDPGPGNVLAGAVDDDRFWALIDEAVRASESAAERFAARADALEDGLSRCTAEEVIGFAERFEACQARAVAISCETSSSSPMSGPTARASPPALPSEGDGPDR